MRAVLLLFPQRGALAKAREEEEKSGEGKFDGDVWWVKQTVSELAGRRVGCRWHAKVAACGRRSQSGEAGSWNKRKGLTTQISNACGSIGLLHALLNLPEGSLEPNSKLLQFKAQSKDLDREFRCRRQD